MPSHKQNKGRGTARRADPDDADAQLPAAPSLALLAAGLLVLVTASPASHAASETPLPKWTVGVDPLTFALGYAHIQVERTVGDAVSIYAGPHARLFDAPWSAEREPFLGVGAEVGVRWYPAAQAPTGWWLMARGVGARLWTTDDQDLQGLGGYASALGGYSAILGERWMLSGGLGVNRIAYDIGGYGVNTWFPAAHTVVGVAF